MIILIIHILLPLFINLFIHTIVINFIMILINMLTNILIMRLINIIKNLFKFMLDIIWLFHYYVNYDSNDYIWWEHYEYMN